jgi:phage terminase large subunit
MSESAIADPDEATLNPALSSFWLAPARNRVLYGGRLSSKSWDAAGVAIALANEMTIRVMCTRQFQNRIDESVYALLKVQIERFGLKSRFNIMQNKITCPETGSEFLFYGRSRNIAEIKGTESVDIHWAEECELMTLEEWRFIDPTLRGEASQHWLIFNPKLVTDYVYRRFVTNPPADTIVRKINYDENPFLSSTALKLVESAKLEDYDEYLHVYEGQPLMDDDTVIIKRSWIVASIDAHIKLGFKPSGRKMLGFDIADGGPDKCATMFAHGSVVTYAHMWKASEDELLQSCTTAWNEARELGSEITYDSIGVGASAGAKFGELNEKIDDRRTRVRYQKFNAGGAVFKPDTKYTEHVLNKDMFSNIKAQAWWILADRFKNTFNAVTKGHEYDPDDMISLDAGLPHIQMLIDELSTPKREFNKNGQVKVESKEDLKKRDVPSPNLADALVMCFAPIQRKMEVSADVVLALAHGRPAMAAGSKEEPKPGITVKSSIVESFKNMGRTR